MAGRAYDIDKVEYSHQPLSRRVLDRLQFGAQAHRHPEVQLRMEQEQRRSGPADRPGADSVYAMKPFKAHSGIMDEYRRKNVP